MISLHSERPGRYQPRQERPEPMVYGYHGSYGVRHSIRHSLRNPRVRRGQLHYGRVVGRALLHSGWRLSSRIRITHDRRRRSA